MINNSKIAIIGSGFLGLTLALRLAEAGNRVTVYESAPEIGGLASAWQIGDVVWDKHYHVTLLSDSFTRKIVEEIGLADEFEWVETKTGFYTDGKLVSMSNTLEFLQFPPLDIVSKFRLGATIFYASRVKDWKALEKISVEDWLTKLSGKRTFEKMWKPLLKAKLGEAYKETSAAFIWATIQRMYAARNSGLKREMFGYVRGGYARVLERFGEHLNAKGVEIRLNSRIENVNKLPNGKIAVSVAESDKYNSVGRIPTKENITVPTLKVSNKSAQSSSPSATETLSQSDAGFHPTLYSSSPSATGNMNSSENFDSVILTCPSNVAAKMLPQLTENEKQKLTKIKYQGIVCASVLMKKSLSNFYVTNITDETPFTGIIEMSALVDKKEFGGNALVYLPKYVAPDDELFEKTNAEIEEIFLTALEKMYPHFNKTDVVAFKISRVRQVFPLPTLDYSANVPSVKTSLENVFIVNSAQITNGTLNVNETVHLAEKFFATEFKERKEIKMEIPKLATFEEDFWQLRSGEKAHLENPEDFWMPSLEERTNLKRGDGVKLIFDFQAFNENGNLHIGGERMWAIVKEKIGDFYLGILDNQPASIGEDFLNKNSEIYFKTEHIIDINFPPKEYLEERFGKDFLENE